MKLALLEAIIDADLVNRDELNIRLHQAMQNRMIGDVTVELVALLIEDVIADYLIDKDEKAL
jgi:hypothetical protein